MKSDAIRELEELEADSAEFQAVSHDEPIGQQRRHFLILKIGAFRKVCRLGLNLTQSYVNVSCFEQALLVFQHLFLAVYRTQLPYSS